MSTRSLAEAREAVRADPKRWRACLYEATGTPLTAREDTRVHLYCLVQTAREKLRERLAELEADGWKRSKAYRLGDGIAKMERGQDAIWLMLDKRRG